MEESFYELPAVLNITRTTPAAVVKEKLMLASLLNEGTDVTARVLGRYNRWAELLKGDGYLHV